MVILEFRLPFLNRSRRQRRRHHPTPGNHNFQLFPKYKLPWDRESATDYIYSFCRVQAPASFHHPKLHCSSRISLHLHQSLNRGAMRSPRFIFISLYHESGYLLVIAARALMLLLEAPITSATRTSILESTAVPATRLPLRTRIVRSSSSSSTLLHPMLIIFYSNKVIKKFWHVLPFFECLVRLT